MSLRTFLSRVLLLLRGERRAQPTAPATSRPAARPIRFARLEDRRVFNASFVLNATGLTVDNFTAPGALNVSEGPGELQFQLGSGMGEWIGNTAPGISILNNGTLLSVQESLLQGPGQSGNISIFAESSQGDIDVYVNDAINLTTSSTVAQFSIHSDGNVLLTHATRGPNPILDAPDHQISVTATGRIDIGGIVHGKSVDLDAGGDIVVSGRVDSRSTIHVKSLAEVLDGQIEQVSFRGELLDITATKGIGNPDSLETDVLSLTAINTSEGTIDIAETGNPGNLSIGRIENIGRAVRLQVAGGSLIDGNDLTGIQTNIQASDLFLQVSNDIGSSGPNPLPLFRNHIDVLVTGNLTATTPGFAAFSGRIDGQLNVQAHDLTLASLNDVDFTRAAQSSLQGLALIADLDGNGSGTVLIGDELSLPESLLIQGADVQAGDGTIDLSAGRILFVSGQSENLHLNLLAGQNGQPGQLDARVDGNLDITVDSAVALADLDGNGHALQSLPAGGTLDLTANGDVIVQGKVSAAGSISLSAGGSMRVIGVVDPDTVTLTAADDIVISGAVSAATAVRITAGTDDTGSLLTTSTAFVESGVPGIPGVMLLRSGDQAGNTELNGTVRARGAITVKAAGGSINGSTELSAPQLSLSSSAGIGNLAPLRIRAATIDADSGTDGIFLKNSIAATYNNLWSGTGNISVESETSAEVVSAFAGDGSLRFSTVDGDLKIHHALTEVGSIVLLSGGHGLVLVGHVSAGGLLRINSSTAVAELDDDPDADLQALQIAIQANTGIGTAASPIEVDGLEMTLAALTASGDIHLQALGHVFVGQAAELQGLKISDPGDMNPATSISLDAGGVIYVVDSIENVANGNVTLTAGEDIFQEAQTRIVTGGSGIISLVAGISQQGSLPGSIQMTEGAVISSQQGRISLLAAGDVALAEILSLSGDISIDAGSGGAIGSIVDNSVEEQLNLATTGLLSLRATTNIGGPDPQQDLNLHVFGLQATAATGGIYVRSTNFLRIHKSGLQTQGGAGDIQVSTAAGGIEVAGRIQAAGTGRIDLTAADDLKIRFGITSDSGSIRLTGRRIEAEADGDISTGGTGAVILQAMQSEIVMDAQAAFTAADGDITLQAATQVLISELHTAGNVSISAAQGQLIDGNDTTTNKRTNITANHVLLKAESIGQTPVEFFTGLPEALEVSVSGNLSVSVQQFAALQGTIAGTGLLEAETLFLMSAGNLGFSTVNPSVTSLALLADVDGTNGGTLFFSTPVVVSGDLRISGADLDGGSPGINLSARNVLLQSGQSETVRLTLNDPGTGLLGALDARSGGALDIVTTTPVQLRDLDRSGQALSSTTGTGSLKLQADGAIRVDGKIFTGSDVVLVSAADIAINASIDPTSITITAADDITVGEQLQATDLISISAGSDGSGDLHTTAASGILAGSSSTGTGIIRLTAGQNSGNIKLQGTVHAGSLLIVNAAAGSVNGATELQAATLDVDAGTGIGNLLPLRVRVNSLSADTSTGDISVISSQSAIVTSLTSAAGAMDFRGVGPTEVRLASTGEGSISLEIVEGELTTGQITAPLGSVFLHTIETGSIIIDAVSAGQNILADSADSITEAGADSDADLHSTSIALSAAHRIGSAGNPLELDGIELQLAAQSDDSEIQLAALNSVIVGAVLNRSGIVIRNTSGTADPSEIRLTSTGRVLLDSEIMNHSRGDIRLQADGDLQQSSGSIVRTFGGGTILLQAGAERFGSQGALGNAITQDDGAAINTDHGQITLQATGDIQLASLASIDGSLAVSAGGTLTPGAIVDNSLSENPNLTTAGAVSLSATASIGGPAPAEDINLNVTALEASSTFGSIHLRSDGSVRLQGLGLRTSSAAGNIELITDAGPIDAAAAVQAANAGNITLQAAEQLILRKQITSDSGFITLNGSRVLLEADGDVATGQLGSIVINAFNEEIILDPEARLAAADGFISLQANRSIFLSQLTTNGNVVAVSVSGDILDNNDTSTVRRLNVAANNLTLTAASIGTTAASFFTDRPNGLEIDLTGSLTVQAQTFAALHGNINGTGTLAAETLFLMSDQNLVFSTPAMPLVTNLALLADLDGDGTGKLTLQNPVAVTGNLRISANDIDGGTNGTRLTARNLLLQSAQSEQIRINLKSPSANQPGLLDARSAADLQIIADSDVELQDLDGSGTALASSLATGNISLAADGNLRVSSKVVTGGNIQLTSTADIRIDAAVDPENVTISAANDITINSHIAAARLIQIAAGNDGTGSLLTNAGSLIEAGGTTDIGDITLSAGNASGEIRLNGAVQAAARLTATAPGGSINGSTELTARFLDLDAATGIGNLNPLRLKADSIAADSSSGSIQLQNERPGVYTSLTTTGDISVTNQGNADFFMVRSLSGTIRLTVSDGALKLATALAADGSLFLTTTGSGDLQIDSATASGRLYADSAASIVEAGDDGAADLAAAQIHLRAVTGIGSANSPIELGGTDIVVAAATATGDIALHATASVTVGEIDQLTGLQIVDPADVNGNGLISLQSDGRLTVSSSVINLSRGSIDLSAAETLLQASSAVIATGGSGLITLLAGSLQAGSQNAVAADITMADGAVIVSEQGRIRLSSSGTQRIGTVRSTSGRIELTAGSPAINSSILDNTLPETPNLLTAGAISLSATGSIGSPASPDDLDIDASGLEASSAFGSIHIRSVGSVQLQGLGLRTSSAAGNIELITDAGPIDAAAAVQAANAGNITLQAAEQLILRKQITSDSGFITLNGSRVLLEADGDVATGQLGSIVINAFNEEIILDPEARLAAADGFISLQANRSIFLSQLTTNGNVVAVSVSGDILDNNDTSTVRRLNVAANNLTLTAASIGTTAASFFTDRPNGLEIDLTGSLTVQAQTFAALHGNINGTGTLAAETLFLMSDQNLVFSTPAMPLVTNLALLADLDGDGTGKLTLQNPVAVTGNLRISANDIDGGTNGTRLTARNLLLQSAQSEQIRINLKSPSANQPGLLDARSAADLQIIADSDVELQDLDGSGTALASSLATGNISLAADGNLRVSSKVVTGGNIQLTSTADIRIDAAVDPENVTISAANDITINSHIAAARLIQIAAGNDGTGSLLTNAGSLIEAGGTTDIGDITLSAGNASGEIRLNGAVQAAARLTATAPGGSINGSTELTARFLDLDAATGIGNLNPLRLKAASIAADSSSGDVSLTNNTAAVYSSVSTGTGTVTLRSNAHAEIQQITSQDGNILVIGESAPIILDTATAGGLGNLTIDNGNGDLRINNLQAVDNRIVILAGTVSEFLGDSAADLTAGRIVLQTANGVGTSGKPLDLSGPQLQLTAAAQSGSLLLAVAGSVTVSSSDGIDGLQLGSVAQSPVNSPASLLSLTATGDMTISAAVQNFLGGDIQLLADGQILQQAASLVTAVNEGSIQVQARGNGAGISMNSGSALQAEHGQIRLTADSSIQLALLQSAGAVTVQSVSGQIVDNNDDSGIPRINVIAQDLLLQAVSIGGPPSDFFNGLPQPLEISLTGRLSVHARDFAVLRGTSFDTESLRADTLFLISDDHLTINGTDPESLGSLALIADADNDGIGTITLRQPVTVADKLRLQGQSITAGSQVIDLSARQILVRSGSSQLLRITPSLNSTGSPAQFDGRANGTLSVVATGSLTSVDLDGDSLAITAAGDASISARDNLTVTSEITAAGSVELIADGRLLVDSTVRGTALRLTSTDSDALISGTLLASQSVSLRAGLGTVGGISVTSTGRIIAGNSPTTGTIQLSSGSIIGDQLLEGRLEAGEQIRIEASGGAISGSGPLLASDIVLTAGTGIGEQSPLQLTAAQIAAESTDGAIQLHNSRDGRFTRLATREGAIMVTGQGNAVFEDVLTVDGSISLTAIAGDLTVILARQQNSGSMSLATLDSGTVRIGRVRTPETLSINSASSILELADDSDNDLEASSLALQSRDGIGTSTNGIELGGFSPRLAAVSDSGGIFLKSDVETFISDVDGISGLQITANSPLSPGDIQFTSRRAVTVESSVVNASGGHIEIQSGDHLRVLPVVAISTTGSGNLTLQAGVRPAGDTSLNFGSLTLGSDTLVSTAHGNITLTAAASVTLHRVQSIDGNLLIRAAVSNSDGRLEGVSLQNSAHISTRGFASLFAGTIDPHYVASLTVDVGSLEATLHSSSLQLNSIGPLRIVGSGLRTGGPRGNIDVFVNSGDLIIASDISAASHGNIRLIASDRIQLLSTARVSTAGDGTVLLNADSGSVLMHATASITSMNGDITITADDDLQIARIISQLGTLTLTGNTGAITEVTPDEAVNLATAGAIWLRAGSGLGGRLPGQDLNLTAGQLDAVSGSNGIFLTSPSSLSITRQGLISAGTNADIHVRSERQVFVRQMLRSDTGNVTVNASGIGLENDSEIIALAGSIDMTAETEGIFMSSGSGGIKGSATVNLRAAADIVAGRIVAGNTLTVTSLTGMITDNNDNATEQLLNLVADAVILDAAAGIGLEDSLEIAARSLAAVNRTSGDIRLEQVAAAGNLGLQLIDNGDRLISLTVADGALTDDNDSGTIARLNLQAGETRLVARRGIGPGNPLETRIATLTAIVTDSGNLELHELDSLQIESLQLTGPGSILIHADRNLLVQERVEAFLSAAGSAGSRPEIRLAAAENLQLAAGAEVTSAANHDITLSAGGDLAMQTGSSVKSAGGDLLIRTDAQHGGDVLVQNLLTSGTRLSVSSGGDIRIGDTAPVLLRATNGDPTRSEQIVIDAAGDIRVTDGVVITTDGNPAASTSANQTDDRLLLIARGRTAGSNQPPDSAIGRVQFDGRVTLRTDGGVATTFLGRPTANATSTTAFFDASKAETSPQGRLVFPGLLRPDPNGGTRGSSPGDISLQIVFEVQITSGSADGLPSEENLRLDIDWRDPSDSQPSTLYVNPGRRLLSHSYSLNELLRFLETGKSQFLVDFSVSHHDSIRVFGSEVQQGAAFSAVPVGRVRNPVTGNDLTTGLISSSDSAATGALQPGQTGGPRDVFSDPNSDADFHFDGAVVRIQVPVSPFSGGPFNSNGNGPGNGNRGNGDSDQPPFPRPPRRAFIPLVQQQPPAKAQPRPQADFEPAAAPLILSNNSVQQETSLEDSIAVSEDLYEVRQSEQGRYTVLRQLDKFEQGEELLNPQALKAWVLKQSRQIERPLLDGEDYELWLVTKKRTASGAVVRIERQLLMFDVIEGQPFPARDDQAPDQPETLPQLQSVPPEPLPPQPPSKS